MFNKANLDKDTDAQVTMPTRGITKSPSAATAPMSVSTSVIFEGAVIKGEITGSNHINIEGRVEGSINLSENEVNVEKTAEIIAEVSGRVVRIHGKVEGNVNAKEKILITSSAHVTGDLSAPKIELQDGSYFEGRISMTKSTHNTPAKPKFTDL